MKTEQDNLPVSLSRRQAIKLIGGLFGAAALANIEVPWAQAGAEITVPPYQVEKFGSAEHPLNQEEIHEILRQINKTEESEPFPSKFGFAYGANAEQERQLGKNFGYESTIDFLKAQFASMEEMFYQGGLRTANGERVKFQLDYYFVINPSNPIPLSIGQQNSDTDHVGGVYGSFGVPHIRADYLGPDDTHGDRVLPDGSIVDVALWHEWGHMMSLGHPSYREVPLHVGASYLPGVNPDWQRYHPWHKYAVDGEQSTLMSGLGNFTADPEYVWLLNYFIKNGYTRKGQETYRALVDYYFAKNADQFILDVGSQYEGKSIDVSRTFYFQPVDPSFLEGRQSASLEEIHKKWEAFSKNRPRDAYFATQVVNGITYVLIGSFHPETNQPLYEEIYQTSVAPEQVQSANVEPLLTNIPSQTTAEFGQPNGFIYQGSHTVNNGTITIDNPLPAEEGWILASDADVLLTIKEDSQITALRWLDYEDFLLSQPVDAAQRVTKMKLSFSMIDREDMETDPAFYDWTVERENLAMEHIVNLPIVSEKK